MATNTNPFYTYSATAGSSKTLQKPQDGGDNNQWGNYINTDLDEIVAAVNALSDKIADASENTLVDFTATTDAVNHVGITNAAAGNGPTISTAGTDSNVDLNVTPKGTGDSVFSNKIKVDDVIEKTTDHGVEIEGVLVKDSIVKTDDIQEKTTDHGVEIDGVLVKDGDVGLATISSKAGTSIGVTLGTDAGDDFNVGSNKLVVEGDTGNIGVGTATPDSNIELSTSSGRSSVKITSVDATGCDVLLERGTAATGSRGIHNESGSLKFSYSTNNFSSRTDQVEISETGSITTPNGEFNGTLGSSAVYPAGGTGNPISVAYLYDEKSNGTAGGTFNGGGFSTRTLNTESDPDGIVSLSSNQFTLGAGTYLLMFSASAYDVLHHRTAIYDVTGTAYISPPGSSELAQTAYNDMTRSMGSCIVTPSSDNVYELRHYANTTKGTSGFGFATSSSLVEIYATVTIFKLK